MLWILDGCKRRWHIGGEDNELTELVEEMHNSDTNKRKLQVFLDDRLSRWKELTKEKRVNELEKIEEQRKADEELVKEYKDYEYD